MLGNLHTAPKSFYDFFSFVTDPTVGCVCNEEKGVQLHVLPQNKARATSRCWPPPSTRPGWKHTLPETQWRVKKKKRKLNTSAITQILELTFKKRRAVTEAITDTVITKTVLQKFPFLDNRTIVSNTKTKKPVELPLLHYFVSCSLVNPSAEFIINQFKQTRL